jgi:hypothetical protein
MSSENKIKCPCGSSVTKSSLYRHKMTKKHSVFLDTGKPKNPASSAEYQRNRFTQNPTLRETQRKACQDYYEQNKDKIHERHRINREKRRLRI